MEDKKISDLKDKFDKIIRRIDQITEKDETQLISIIERAFSILTDFQTNNPHIQYENYFSLLNKVLAKIKLKFGDYYDELFRYFPRDSKYYDFNRITRSYFKQLSNDDRLIYWEHFLINNTLKRFNKEISNHYPQYDFTKKEGIKKFSQQFKREFSPLLTEIVIDWFRQDDRKKFSFEKALWPFYTKTEEYRFKLMKKKFRYSPFNTFY